MSNISGGDVMAATYQAIRSISLRQRQIADNIANVNTPGYIAGKVSFEETLRDAIRSGDRDRINSMNPTVSKSTAPTRTDGNNVNLDEETLASQEANLQYQLMIEIMNSQFRSLRTAAREGRS
jgi:flagellar basal-body rod protein FlgB